MQIVVWNQVDSDEDGAVHESWRANVVHKAISASGPTAANAVFQLVSWLRKSVAERFASAKPFADDAIAIPEDWDVRVWEG